MRRARGEPYAAFHAAKIRLCDAIDQRERLTETLALPVNRRHGMPRQAFALGRDDTAWYQRARFFCSGWIAILTQRPKSTAIMAVISAIV